MKMLAWLLTPMFALTFSIVPAIACPDCGGHGAVADDTKKETEKKTDGEDMTEKEDAEEAPETATIDKKAPEFTLKNASGDDIKLSDYKDKIVVLEWINFDCPIVVKHYKDKTMQDLAKSYRDDDIVWLQICSSAEGKQGHFTGEDLTKRIEKESCDAKFYLIDTDGAIGTKYGAKTTPHMYVIDKEGKLRYQGAIDSSKNGAPVGEDGTNYLKDAVTAVKDGKEVTTKETKPYGCGVKYAAATNGKRGKN
jgi:peroxiredoxin